MAEKETKSSRTKWIAAILIIIVVMVAAGFYFKVFSLPTGLITAGNQATETTTGNQPAPFTVTGDEIIAKDTTESLPYYESVDLEAGRYGIQVVTDRPVWIMLYNQANFDDWKNGSYGSLRIGTGCCNENMKTDRFSGNFDINEGEKGVYYIVIQGTEKTSIKFKITQILKF